MIESMVPQARFAAFDSMVGLIVGLERNSPDLGEMVEILTALASADDRMFAEVIDLQPDTAQRLAMAMNLVPDLTKSFAQHAPLTTQIAARAGRRLRAGQLGETVRVPIGAVGRALAIAEALAETNVSERVAAKGSADAVELIAHDDNLSASVLGLVADAASRLAVAMSMVPEFDKALRSSAPRTAAVGDSAARALGRSDGIGLG